MGAMTPNGTTHPTGSGPACPVCIRALTNPYVGETQDGCFDCQVRYLSHQPEAARVAFYSSLPRDRALEYVAAVAAEYRRRKELIADRSVQ